MLHQDRKEGESKSFTEGNSPKIAFVYDWLVNYNMGGGEKVLEALMEIWPEAPVFTLIHDPSGPCGRLTTGREIIPSFIQHLPGYNHIDIVIKLVNIMTISIWL